VEETGRGTSFGPPPPPHPPPQDGAESLGPSKPTTVNLPGRRYFSATPAVRVGRPPNDGELVWIGRRSQRASKPGTSQPGWASDETGEGCCVEKARLASVTEGRCRVRGLDCRAGQLGRVTPMLHVLGAFCAVAKKTNMVAVGTRRDRGARWGYDLNTHRVPGASGNPVARDQRAEFTGDIGGSEPFRVGF